MPTPLSWTAMIAQLAKNGRSFEVMRLFVQMRAQGSRPNHATLCSVIATCSSHGPSHLGPPLHGLVLKSRPWLEPDIGVWNSLVSMYSKRGSLAEALMLFERMKAKDTVSWNIAINGCLREGYFEMGFGFFRRMRVLDRAQQPDPATFTTITSASAQLGFLQLIETLHCLVMKNGFYYGEIPVGNALISTYFVHEKLFDEMDERNVCSRKVFDEMPVRNVVSWTAMITGYFHREMFNECLILFKECLGSESVRPNSVTFCCSLQTCTVSQSFKLGLVVHGLVIKYGVLPDSCLESSLMDMYAKWGQMLDAVKLFEMAESHDMVTTTVLLVGLAQNGFVEEALSLFSKMRNSGIEMDETVVSAVLGACTNGSCMALGLQIHGHAIKSGVVTSNVFVGNGLVTMYSKSGSLNDSMRVFNEMNYRNQVSYNAMIAGLAHHGRGAEAVELFEVIEREGLEPNDVTFLSLLHACSHGGLVEKGFRLFESMYKDHGMSPRLEHYACMVDMLGRGGRLKEAKNFIDGMPYAPGAQVWQALLGACKIHGDTEMGEFAAKQLLSLVPEKSSAYVLMSNIYSFEGRWDEKARVMKEMRERGVKKEAGVSWIEVGRMVHGFVVGDRMHPQAEVIHEELKGLIGLMRDEGYVPDLRFLLHDMDLGSTF
ncbi:pentatricopeptide repeat-containing protein At3g05340 [Amborella trichopoda]|nr:pentatricopeptide repeat-containing protein At3g05340 [Amborella trichopoda]|eukprot:XP_006851086.2 pentatricopeptide repeat-containing protein At3g05340 [Amborella trichopoda]